MINYNYQLPQLKRQDSVYSLKDHLSKFRLFTTIKNFNKFNDLQFKNELNNFIFEILLNYNNEMSKYVVPYSNFNNKFNILNLKLNNIYEDHKVISRDEIINIIKQGKKIFLDNIYLDRRDVNRIVENIYDSYDNEFIYKYYNRELINIPVQFCYFPSYEDNLFKILILFIYNYNNECFNNLFITFLNKEGKLDKGIIALSKIEISKLKNKNERLYVQCYIKSFYSKKKSHISFKILPNNEIVITNNNNIKLITFMNYKCRETQFILERSISNSQVCDEDIILLNNISIYIKHINIKFYNFHFIKFIEELIKSINIKKNNYNRLVEKYNEYKICKTNIDKKYITNILIINKIFNNILPIELWYYICLFLDIKILFNTKC